MAAKQVSLSKVVIAPAKKRGKLFTAHIVNDDGKVTKIHFGDANGEQYPIHKDPLKKYNYIVRHAVNENWDDPYTAGFWSRFILWNRLTLADSVKDTSKKLDAPIYLVGELP